MFNILGGAGRRKPKAKPKKLLLIKPKKAKKRGK